MTDWEALARPSLQGLERYDPGPSRDQMKERHGLEPDGVVSAVDRVPSSVLTRSDDEADELAEE